MLGNRFVDQGIESLGFVEQAPRFQKKLALGAADPLAERQLLGDVGQSRRLSIAFRFAAGSSEFQSKSRQDVVRLAELLQAAEFQKKAVMLLGFTDETGSPLANTRLALRRAEQVRNAVLVASGGRIAPRQIAARGYGPLAPVACNDTAHGQYLNRRVEVWIRDLYPAAELLDPTDASRARQAQQAAAKAARR